MGAPKQQLSILFSTVSLFRAQCEIGILSDSIIELCQQLEVQLPILEDLRLLESRLSIEQTKGLRLNEKCNTLMLLSLANKLSSTNVFNEVKNCILPSSTISESEVSSLFILLAERLKIDEFKRHKIQSYISDSKTLNVKDLIGMGYFSLN